MGLLSRRQPRAEVVNPGVPLVSRREKGTSGYAHSAAGQYDHGAGHLNGRPSFGQWIRATWLDLLTMVAMSAIALGVYHARPAPQRSFAVYFQDGEIVYPEFAYPNRHEIIPIWLAALLASLIPIAIILLCQIRVRSFWDTSNAILGLLYALIAAAVFQVFLKWLIGGLRPHFLAICQPRLLPNGVETGNGLRQIYYDRKICTGNENQINDALESFPSGHTTAAFAGFVFLYLYLNAKLKVFANYHPAMWKLIAIYAPILGAILIGGALTIDEFHNWYDILAGAIIGTVMAFSAYRMVYASIWDFRYNHIPLTRHMPFTYGDDPSITTGSGLFTRRAGWGAGSGHGSSIGPSSTAGVIGGLGYHSHVTPTTTLGTTEPLHQGAAIERRPVGAVEPDVARIPYGDAHV